MDERIISTAESAELLGDDSDSFEEEEMGESPLEESLKGISEGPSEGPSEGTEEENVNDFVPVEEEEESGEQLPPRTVYRAYIENQPWRKCSWGLDIGTQNIKVVGIRKGLRKNKLAYLAIIEVAPGRRPSKQDVNAEAKVAAILNALEDLDLEFIKINTALDRASVLVRQIQYPAAARDKLLSALQWEVRKYIPFKPNEVVVDAQIIEDPTAAAMQEQKEKLDILLVAATKEHMGHHQELLERVGVRSDIIDADPLNLMNLYLTQKDPEVEETILLLDLGATATTLNVISSAGHYFTLSLSVGGTRFTNEIQSHCQLAYAIADELKFGRKPGDCLSGDKSMETAFDKAMEKNYDLLTKEIRQALVYFNKQTGINHFNRMLLTGGGAFLPGLTKYLLENLGIGVEIYNPLEKIDVDKKHFDVDKINSLGPQLAIATALALRGGV